MSSSPEALPLRSVPRAVPLAAVPPLAIDSVDPGRSVAWWAAAGALFLRHPLRWTVSSAALVAGLALLALLPAVGLVAAALLSPMAIGAWMLAARQADRGGPPAALGVLAAQWRDHARPLLALGALLAAATLGIDVVGRAFGLAAHIGAVAIDGPADPVAQAALGRGMLALLLLLVASLLTTAALWFAPALVVLRGATPRQAVLASLRAVLDNGLTFLLFGVIQLFLLAAVTSLPLQAGWLVLLPVMLLTGYVSYREVFEG